MGADRARKIHQQSKLGIAPSKNHGSIKNLHRSKRNPELLLQLSRESMGGEQMPDQIPPNEGEESPPAVPTSKRTPLARQLTPNSRSMSFSELLVKKRKSSKLIFHVGLEFG